MRLTKARFIGIGSFLVLLVGSVVFAVSASGESLGELWAKAKAGDAEAQGQLGTVFQFGFKNMPEDHQEAVRWYRLAAEQGDTGAMCALGIVYGTSDVVRNHVNAHMWFNLGSAQGNKCAKRHLEEILTPLMTKEDISKAQRLATEWEEAHRESTGN